MRRRDFIKVIAGSASAWPLVARAQSVGLKRRLGVLILNPEGDPLATKRIAVLQDALVEHGWRIGGNLQIDYRWGAFGPERAGKAVAELLNLKPDVILANSVDATRAALQATRSVPIVFNAVSGPVELGFISSFSHPGGNITGFTNLEPSIGAKWLELIKEMSPQVTHVGFVFDPDATPAAPLFYHAIEQAAAKLMVVPMKAPVREATEIDPLIGSFASGPKAALIVQADTFLASHRKLIIDSAARYRVPVIYPFDYFAAAGGLISYGPDVTEQFRESANYIDRILKGEKPGDLPVQEPTKFDLMINLKTAKALGIEPPQSLVIAADTVFE